MLEILVFLIPALPLAAALISAAALFAGDRLHYRWVQGLVCTAAFASFAATVYVATIVFVDPAPREFVAWRWMTLGDVAVDVGVRIDALSVVMMLVVTGFGWLVALFSRNYMHKDRSFTRYFASLALFLFAMLVLVMSNNFVLLFLGWELVGVCSYLLIGHYYERASAARAGTRAFLMNRVGDAGFLLGIFAIAQAFGSVNYHEVLPLAFTLDTGTATLIALCLLLGAMGKSAQLPLGTWLARAMEGPTPSSALIHAATMVTAGVYMIVRAHSIYDAAPDALLVVALVGLVTALYGTLVGQTLSDIKGILAASTTTQLGLMFVACGLGAYTVAIFHLVAHAFLKTYLFLTAPSILHHLHGKASPGAVAEPTEAPQWRHLVPPLAVATLAGGLGYTWWDTQQFDLAAAVLLAAGALSVVVTLHHLRSLAQRTLGHGAHSAQGDAHGHGPSVMAPALGLVALIGVGAAAGLLPGTIEQSWFGALLAPAIGNTAGAGANALTVLIVAGVVVVVLLWSWFSATRLERFACELPGRDMLRWRGLYSAAMHRFWLDECYERFLVAPVRRLASAIERFDRGVVDKLVGGTSTAARVDTAGRVWEARMLDARGQAGGDRAVLSWLQTVAQSVDRAPQAEAPPRGMVGWLTQTAATDAAWVEREVIGRANGIGGRFTAAAAALAAWAERVLFGRGLNEGVPQAGRIFGHQFERLEGLLTRPAVGYAMIAVGLAAAVWMGV